MVYRPDIDGLRAVAVLAVVGFHAFPDRVSGGFVGVDVFFVISGYLISGVIAGGLREGRFGVLDFYARRIKRIFPALALVLAACQVFGWFTLLPDEYKRLGKHIAAGAGFVSNLVLWREAGYFDAAAELKPLLHLWSLGIEEQFYLVWPALLLLGWRRRWSLLALTAGVAAASFALDVGTIGAHPLAAFYLPVTRLWELSLGGALVFMAWPGSDGPADASSRRADVGAALGMSLIVAGVFGFTRATPFPGWWALLPTVGTALVIAAGPRAWLNRRVLSRRAVVLVGLISYPLYLWHWPLLSLARTFAGDIPAAGVRAALVLASLALAWLTYALVEKPIRLGRSRAAVPVGLCALVALVGGAGLGTYRGGGWAFRLPELVQGRMGSAQIVNRWLATFEYDYEARYRAGTCFLENTTTARFAPECTDPAGTPGTPLIALWGDSYAAHLYPGLTRVKGGSHRIAQLTVNGCPPAADVVERCRAINAASLAVIERIRPDTVILAAHWRPSDGAALHPTIEALQRMGLRHIVVVGPVPQWMPTLPRALANFWAQASPRRLPERMTFGLRADVFALDDSMRAELAQAGVSYVSAVRLLCDGDGCLVRTGETADTLTAWDWAHLTTAGSEYLVRRLPLPD